MNKITQLCASEDHRISEAVDFILDIALEKAKNGVYQVEIYENEYPKYFSFYIFLEASYWREKIADELRNIGYFVMLRKDYSKGYYYVVNWNTPALFKKKV